MKNVISFKSRLGWISAVEKNKHIISVSFGKSKSKGSSKELKKLQKKLSNYFSGKTKIITSNILMQGTCHLIKSVSISVFVDKEHC